MISSQAAVLLLVHVLATSAMIGLIWFVQVVHYPLFNAVGESGFADYEQSHQRRTSFVVGPLMAIEGLTAVSLALAPPQGVQQLWALIGLVVLGCVHASTIFLQVPEHTALSEGFDARRVQRLVRTNWVRTIGWTLRGFIVIAMTVQAVTT